MKRRLEASWPTRRRARAPCSASVCGVVNTVDHYTSRPLKIEDVDTLDAQAMCELLHRAFRQRRQFHLLLRRQLQGGRHHAAPRDVPRRRCRRRARPTRGPRRAPAVPGNRATRDRDARGRSRAPRPSSRSSRTPGSTRRRPARCAPRPTSSRPSCATSCASSWAARIPWSVGYSNTSPQPGYGTTTVQFGSSPENVEKLVRP